MYRSFSLALVASILVPAFASAATLTYDGVSQTAENGNGQCTLVLSIDAQGEINGYRLSGDSKKWEILSENGTSYGSDTGYAFGDFDYLDADVFAVAKFEVSEGWFGDTTTLRSTIKSADLGIKGTTTLTLEGTLPNLKSAAGKLRYSKLITLADEKIECVDLKLRK